MGDESSVKVGEIEERLDAMGQESEAKAAKAVKEVYSEAESQEKKERWEVLNRLDSKRKGKKIFNYTESLAIYMANKLKEEDFPSNWHFRVKLTAKDKIRLDIFSNQGQRMVRGIKISGEPKYDMHAAEKLAIWAGDNILKTLQENGEKTKGNIILP